MLCFAAKFSVSLFVSFFLAEGGYLLKKKRLEKKKGRNERMAVGGWKKFEDAMGGVGYGGEGWEGTESRLVGVGWNKRRRF